MKRITTATLNNFNIGFEFEFYVKTSALLDSNKNEVTKVPKEIMREYGHLFTVKNKLKSEDFSYKDAGKFFLQEIQKNYPDRVWKNLFNIVQDGSLSDYDTRDSGKVGVEMVLKHQNGLEAKQILLEVLNVLKLPQFLTDSNCGLHINVSLKDSSRNNKHMAFDLMSVIDIDKINSQFGRSRNEFCQSNGKEDTFNLLDDYFDAGQLIASINQNNKRSDALGTFCKNLRELKKPAKLNKFIAMIENGLKNQTYEMWKDNRPAIAPKRSDSGHYIEFRSTGGKDYQKKTELIIETLATYLNAMLKVSKEKKKSMALR